MKRALVTGGASPIGAAIARALAAAGHHVTVHAHANGEAARMLADQLPHATALVCDLADAGATADAMGTLLEAGPVQLIVHNAGIHDDAPLAGMRRDQWHRVIDISLNGFFAVVQPLLLPMIGTRWGRIVAISSVSALLGNRGQVNYAAAKAGLIGAVKSLAREVGSRGITVNAIAPGIIGTTEFEAARLKELIPLNRVGTPEEVASLAGFLCSDDAAYITGQSISINGGMI